MTEDQQRIMNIATKALNEECSDKEIRDILISAGIIDSVGNIKHPYNKVFTKKQKHENI